MEAKPKTDQAVSEAARRRAALIEKLPEESPRERRETEYYAKKLQKRGSRMFGLTSTG